MTTTSTLRLSEVCRHLILPADICGSAWPKVRDTITNLGVTLDIWQDGAGKLILAVRRDGLYAADTVVISIPRQVGKTYLIGAIVFALCLIEPGLTVIWTAHHSRTSAETFKAMKAFAERERVAPHVKRVAQANGQEGVHFHNGSRVLFGAREHGFGLGFAGVGVLILDEGQRVTARAMDDLIPTTNAHPNPLIFLMGTPPRPSDPGESFAMLRDEALSGESDGTLYFEMSADRGADPNDRTQWAKANASYPHRTTERAILRLKKNLTPDSFNREALGIWDEAAGHVALIAPSRWAALADTGPADGKAPAALAVDMNHARQIKVAAAWHDGDDLHTELVFVANDSTAAVDWVARRAGRRIEVVIDAAGPAASLAPLLKARRVKVRLTGAAEMVRACGSWLDAVMEGRLTHAGQEAVDKAVAGARRRAIGGAGGWGLDRKDPDSDIAPLVASVLAVLGALLAKAARPGRVTDGNDKASLTTGRVLVLA